MNMQGMKNGATPTVMSSRTQYFEVATDKQGCLELIADFNLRRKGKITGVQAHLYAIGKEPLWLDGIHVRVIL